MRTLTANEVALVHGANLWDDICEWWNDLWETEEQVEEAANALEAYNDVVEAVRDGNTTPEHACETLGSLLSLVPETEINPYDADLVAEFCANAANVLQDGIKSREQQMIDQGASNDIDIFDEQEYFGNDDWLDDVYADWNSWVVDDFWDNYNDYAYVEIEIIDGDWC